jgi:N-acetylglucosaminyldiphosphoundecaprenol N-acetyl-beta-D-mannosaminyltransferase
MRNYNFTVLEKRNSIFGQVQLLDVESQELINLMISTINTEDKRNKFIALHVSYFNNLRNLQYIASLQNAYLYADGTSVVLAAKIRGFKHIRRAATTDIAPKLISELKRIKRRQVKIGLIGGDESFILQVRKYFTEEFGVEVVYALNGFPETWDYNHFRGLSKEVDIAFIGMGVPKESIFLEANKKLFRASLILTCGGWFGFLIGGESRAPVLLQNYGLEWLWRLAQSPMRLLPRYFSGTINFLKFIFKGI